MCADAMARLDQLLEVVYGADYNDTWLNPTADPAAIGTWTARLQTVIADSSPEVQCHDARPRHPARLASTSVRCTMQSRGVLWWWCQCASAT